MSEPNGTASRRTVLRTGLALATSASASAPGQAATASQTHTRNVRDFGAKGDGVTDDTEAFNRATRADEPWSWDLLSSIIVPAGRYRIAGTVFLRKGQSLIGEGLSTYIDATGVTRSTFVMGRRGDKARGVEDPGGLPVRLEQMMGLGGAAEQGFIFAAIPGFQISALFLTAVGMGIEVEGADGILSDIEIDQCLTAIFVRNSQNLALSNLNVYLANYGISFAGSCRDITVANSIFCYTKYATVLLGDGTDAMSAIAITGCIFTNNVPYPTLEGFIYSRAGNSDLLISGCIFRNPSNFAINQGAGVGLSLVVQGCVFDGQRTNPDYNQSLAPKGIKTGHGRFTVLNCTFRHLVSDAIRIAPGLVSLAVDGGSLENVAGVAIDLEGDAGGPISIREMRGLAQVTTEGASHRITLPWLGGLCRWRVTVNGRVATAPTVAAEFMVAAGPGAKAMAQTLWSMGEAAIVSVALDGHALSLRLDARRFGKALPMIDVAGCA